jgi:hypothetical protein
MTRAREVACVVAIAVGPVTAPAHAAEVVLTSATGVVPLSSVTQTKVLDTYDRNCHLLPRSRR